VAIFPQNAWFLFPTQATSFSRPALIKAHCKSERNLPDPSFASPAITQQNPIPTALSTQQRNTEWIETTLQEE
jgi:hypothetical protein